MEKGRVFQKGEIIKFGKDADIVKILREVEKHNDKLVSAIKDFVECGKKLSFERDKLSADLWDIIYKKVPELNEYDCMFNSKYKYVKVEGLEGDRPVKNRNSMDISDMPPELQELLAKAKELGIEMRLAERDENGAVIEEDDEKPELLN